MASKHDTCARLREAEAKMAAIIKRQNTLGKRLQTVQRALKRSWSQRAVNVYTTMMGQYNNLSTRFFHESDVAARLKKKGVC